MEVKKVFRKREHVFGKYECGFTHPADYYAWVVRSFDENQFLLYRVGSGDAVGMGLYEEVK